MTQPLPHVLKAGIVLVDPVSGTVSRVISMQYNPDSVTRTLQVQGIGESGDRSEALRLKGPAIETFRLDAELDATDQLEFPDSNPDVVALGLHPQIAALESVLNPTSVELVNQNTLAQAGTLEIAPSEAPLTLFVWSAQRVVPVRITEFSVTEEAFDTSLNPIRARLSLGMRTLSVDDLPFTHRGSAIFLNYLQAKERLSAKAPSPALSALGIGEIG
ncbi:hypothetical protein [Paraburkholderia rhizosphaerae]|jgi:hypothetical protein|uniref:Uncharacterized protein n=1 Tax=Paraburkholderia rhizosphaerae TaxID=480658 RepID=A0A4R8LT89_9BURK|nr:hypothetical protein [Paraburkholderia rhizosphaerae]TDY50910.1 hypothetical protein BX592_108147 [Paraburkholderia rhizosphaerae]